MGTRPVKRQRTESVKTNDLLPVDELEHSSEVWFEDGNVIIQAESIIFRVHRGILSAQSPILRNLLSSLSDIKPAVFGGCPILSLTDHAKDVAHFLKAMMDRRCVFLPYIEARILKNEITHSYFHEKDIQTFETTSAILRLGKKYGVDHLREDAQRRLAAQFPTSLHSLDKLHAKIGRAHV